MHAKLDREGAQEGQTFFFAALPDAPEPLVRGEAERSTYGAPRRPHWPTVVAIVALHALFFQALISLNVIRLPEQKKQPLVVDLIAEPPAPPVEKPKPEPVEMESAQPVVVAPAPIVQTIAASPPPIAVAVAPPPPKPLAESAPPATGPVTVGNLDERLIEGRPPRYPVESRRKREQGTVVLRLLIGTDGRVAQISVAQSSGFERLDRAALHAVRHWRWEPMVRDGQPVELRGVMSIPFVLNG